MLPRSKRLSVPLFANVLAKGSIVHSPLFTARIVKTAGQHSDSRFSAVVSKKVAKTAVERNKLRRRTYAALSKITSKIKDGFHVILLAKNAMIKAEPKDIVADLENLFVKSNLIK
jgi:ribonuclease P protein component